MKILLISHARNDENAGASRVYHLLAHALRERGHQVTLYHYDDLRVPRLLQYVVLRMALPQFIFWRFFKEANQGYDIIFSSNGMAYKIFRNLKSRIGRPFLIHHLHGLSYFDHQSVVTEKMRGHVRLSPFFMAWKGRFVIAWDALGARYADAIIVQNKRDQDYLLDTQNQQPEAAPAQAPITLVPAALHPRIEEASRDAVAPEKRNPQALLWFGSWVERKGNYYVSRAFQEIKGKFPEATLTLGGTGCSSQTVEAFFPPELRSSLRVLPRIDMETQIREYNSHGIFIFPSLSEGFGLALIEAMAMGLPCVTTSTGLVSDWVEDREQAIVVAMASAKHLAQGVIELLENDALRHHVARTGQKLATEFTVERCVKEYLAVFERGRVS